jgi:hypothetical protein
MDAKNEPSNEISMNQCIVSAVAEKVVVYHAEELFAERSARGKHKKLSDVLEQVQQRPTDEYDRL